MTKVNNKINNVNLYDMYISGSSTELISELEQTTL